MRETIERGRSWEATVWYSSDHWVQWVMGVDIMRMVVLGKIWHSCELLGWPFRLQDGGISDVSLSRVVCGLFGSMNLI